MTNDEKIALWLGWKKQTYEDTGNAHYIDPNGGIWYFPPCFADSIDAWHKYGLFDEIERRGLRERFLDELIKIFRQPGVITLGDAFWSHLTAPASVLADALIEVI